MNIRVSLIVCLIAALGTQECSVSNISREEKRWALRHPVAAVKVKRVAQRCDALYNRSQTRAQLDSFSSGGKLDAFRHAFYMAAFAQKIKPKKIRALGEAHEKTNYRQFLKSKTEEGEVPDSISTVMDLFNNDLGISIGSSLRKLTLLELQRTVIYEIDQGKALIIRRDRQGRFLRCDGSILKTDEFRRQWFVPKCLVASSRPPG